MCSFWNLHFLIWNCSGMLWIRSHTALLHGDRSNWGCLGAHRTRTLGKVYDMNDVHILLEFLTLILGPLIKNFSLTILSNPCLPGWWGGLPWWEDFEKHGFGTWQWSPGFLACSSRSGWHPQQHQHFARAWSWFLWIQAHLEGYGFDLQNPEAVMRGEKPIVKEVRRNWIKLCGPLILQIGPFIYKAVTVKDSVNMSNGETNLKYGDDGKTLTFRPRWDWWLRVTGMTLVPHP